MRKHFQAAARLIVALALVASAFVGAPPAEAQTQQRNFGMESAFLSSLNGQRAARGLPSLTLNSSMSSAAAGWTAQMVNGTFLAHSSDIVSGTPANWTKVGENVGRGQSVASLTQAFMNSASHARNVLDPDFNLVGIAVIVHPNGRVYTTHRFAALPGTSSAPVPAATPIPAPPTATPIPPLPTPIPPPPTPTPIPPPPTATPIPPPPTATPIQPPPTATPTSAPPTATTVPATATPEPTTPAEPTSAPDPTPTTAPSEAEEFDFGPAPERLAFASGLSQHELGRLLAVEAKTDLKLTKITGWAARE